MYTTVYAVPEVWTRTCWWSHLVCDLCTPQCTFMGIKGERRRKMDASSSNSSELGNYAKFTVLKFINKWKQYTFGK